MIHPVLFLRRLLSRITHQQSIGTSLLIWIILFSSLVTVVLSAAQLYVDYKLELSAIINRLNEIESSYKGSVEASLWNVDIEQLNIQLEGIKRLPDIQSVMIEERYDIGSAIFLQKGSVDTGDVKRQYELTHLDGAEIIHIGTLYIEVSLNGVYRRLLNKALTIMLVQAVKTFFVSLFILFLFYRLVTRHLISIEHFLKHVDLRRPFHALTLSRVRHRKEDEIDKLVGAYNAMSVNLRSAYDEVKVINEELQQDVVARKKAEAEVKLLNEELEYRVEQRTAELEAANKELNSFCYSVSHDLRAPVRRVQGFRRNFEDAYAHQIDEQGRHYLSRIEVCVNEMNVMIGSFLKLSKSTSFELKRTEVNLTAIVFRIVSRLKEKDNLRDVLICVQEGVFANCDSRLVELLLTNLVENAWKYTSRKPRARISFGTVELYGEHVFVVEDDGAGFNMEFAKNLFTPFARLHSSEEFPGAGIGLATVKRIVARHGGHVWAESSVGKGAKFFFTLKMK